MEGKVIAQFNGSDTKKAKKIFTIIGLVLASIYFCLMYEIIYWNLGFPYGLSFGELFILLGVGIFLLFWLIGVMIEKNSKSKKWALYKNNLYICDEQISLASITDAEHTLSTPASKGYIRMTHGKVSTIYYPHSQASVGMQAAEHILIAVGGEKARETVDKQKDALKNGYRKKCNVCGHIYCYSLNDLAQNTRRANDAALSSLAGIGGALGGYYAASATHTQTANNQLNSIIDYTKCPNCGSQDIVDATEEDIQNNKAPKSQVLQQVSSADELKKYKELLDQGVITQEEFDAKKKQLLGL